MLDIKRIREDYEGVKAGDRREEPKAASASKRSRHWTKKEVRYWRKSKR